MKSVFGMRIFPERKHLTDDEVVAEVRNSLAKYEGKRKWFLGFHVVGVAATMLMIGWLLQMIVKIAPVLKGAPGAQEIWFVLGLAVGWIAGHLLSATVHSLIVVVGDTIDLRTKRLLVRYYDAYMTICPQDADEEMTGGHVP